MCVFFFNDTATTEIYTLSLHDALPILWLSNSRKYRSMRTSMLDGCTISLSYGSSTTRPPSISARMSRSESSTRPRSEEHTSELQSRQYLVCRLLLEKKNTLAVSPLYTY